MSPDADFKKLLDETYSKLLETDLARKPDGNAKVDDIEEDLGDLALDDSDDQGLTAEAIEAVMEVLISKEVLYEPLQSLDIAYTEWASHSLEKESADRQCGIKKQMSLIKEIIQIFEASSTMTRDCKKQIFEKMQDVQELGLPPEEVTAKISV